MHVLRRVRRRRARERLPELRRRLRPAPNPAGQELEGRQLPREGPSEHEGKASSGRRGDARAVRRRDQFDTSGEAVSQAARWLVVASATIVLLLGLIHLAYTFRGRKLHPRDTELLARM